MPHHHIADESLTHGHTIDHLLALDSQVDHVASLDCPHEATHHDEPSIGSAVRSPGFFFNLAITRPESPRLNLTVALPDGPSSIADADIHSATGPPRATASRGPPSARTA